MSVSELSKSKSLQDEKENNNIDKQKSTDTTISMDLVDNEETVNVGAIRAETTNHTSISIENEPANVDEVNDTAQLVNRAAEAKNHISIPIETDVEPPSNTNRANGKSQLANLVNLKRHVIVQREPGGKITVMGLYDNIIRGGQRNEPMYPRQVWRQEQPPPQPQQTMWTQYGPAQGQGLGYPPPEYGGYSGAYGYENRGPMLYDPSSRNSFVALVMGIVFVMLLVTAIFLGVVLGIPELKYFFQRVGWLILLLAIMGLMTANYALVCSPCARRPPCNIICLIITTAAMSVIAAKITSHYRTEIILYAVVATGAVVFVCVMLACSKFDFTSYMLYIIAIATAFSVLVIMVLLGMAITGTMMKPLILVILVIGTLIQIVMEIKSSNKVSIYQIVHNYFEEQSD